MHRRKRHSRMSIQLSTILHASHADFDVTDHLRVPSLLYIVLSASAFAVVIKLPRQSCQQFVSNGSRTMHGDSESIYCVERKDAIFGHDGRQFGKRRRRTYGVCMRKPPVSKLNKSTSLEAVNWYLSNGRIGQGKRFTLLRPFKPFGADLIRVAILTKNVFEKTSWFVAASGPLCRRSA